MSAKNFYELEVPVSDNPSKMIDWYVRIKDDDPSYYILNDVTCSLGNLMHHPSIDFYFKTEIDAHKAASAYYNSHYKQYPYNSEWALAIGRTPDVGDNDDESQTMRFA